MNFVQIIDATCVRREVFSWSSMLKKYGLFARKRIELFFNYAALYPTKLEELDEGYSVDDALISVGFGKFQTLALLYSGVAYSAEAMEVMILSFIGPAVQSEWSLTSQEKSLISSAVFAGMLVGAYTWGLVSDNYGRRKGFLFTALVTSGAGFLSSFSPNYIFLVILRFFVGAGLGGGPVLFSWFLEFVPAPSRGSWMVFFSLFWSLGTVLEASLAWVVMPALGWRWLLGLSSLPSFLLLIFYKITPESPRFLCMKGRKFDAVLVLESIARLNKKMLPSGELALDHKELNKVSENTDDLRATHAEQDSKSGTSFISCLAFKFICTGTLYKLLSTQLIRTTLLLWMAFFGNVFTYYGVILLTSGLSDEGGNCKPVRIHMYNKEGTNLYKDVFITSMAEVPGLILSGVIVDRIGRKLSVASMMFATFAFLVPLVFHQKEVLTTALLFCARICITGSITTLSIYAPEIYPTSVRSTGYGTANMMGKIGGIVSPLVAVGLVDGCHQGAAVLLFEALIFFTGMAVLFFPVETKGCKLKDSL